MTTFTEEFFVFQVRQLIFTSEKVQSRRQFPATLEFNVPVVLTHLLGEFKTGKVTL